MSSEVSPNLLYKLFSTYGTPPTNHMKYSEHQLYEFPGHEYVSIVLVLFQDFLLDQTHIPRVSFLIIWNQKVS